MTLESQKYVLPLPYRTMDLNNITITHQKKTIGGGISERL